ncbi:MAG TPA: STAS domain-containing protein [Noviherbaspirillum sp.]|nr:STAS domain-containing protein [Noviherbaspirillum sp.]
MHANNKNTIAALRIQGEMTIYRAIELKRTLMAPLQEGVILEANLADVTEIDTTGLQLLMLAKKTAQERGGELRLVEHSAAVIDVLALLDLADWFGEPLPLKASEGMRNAA